MTVDNYSFGFKFPFLTPKNVVTAMGARRRRQGPAEPKAPGSAEPAVTTGALGLGWLTTAAVAAVAGVGLYSNTVGLK